MHMLPGRHHEGARAQSAAPMCSRSSRLPSRCDGRWRGSWWLGGGLCVRGVRDSSRAEESL